MLLWLIAKEGSVQIAKSSENWITVVCFSVGLFYIHFLGAIFSYKINNREEDIQHVCKQNRDDQKQNIE